MKKLLKTMLGAVAAVSVMCGLAACDGGDGECEHVWNEGETTVAATCTEDGVLTYTCTLCDEERTEPIASLGHDFTGEWQKDAQGHWHKCSRCEAADDVVAHTMEDGEVITPATEEEEGTQKIVCSVCGYESIKTLPVLVGHSAASEWSSDDTYHWHVCTAHGDCGMQLDKSEHDWTETDRVEATETANGKVTYECSVCKAAKEEILYYDGHVAATEWSSDKTHHWHACTAHENCAEQMDKAEHDWDDGEVTKAATCAQKGEKTFTCETCGATKTEEIPQLAHDFSEEWSSDAEGHWHKCKNCDATDTKAAHDMIYKNDEASGKHIGECKVCGYKGSPADHVWGEGEVTKPATLYAEGERTFTCACSATRTETIAAGADFAADFTLENQDGAWIYGKANITNWSDYQFALEFIAATDKNADSWLIDGMEIKSGWVNAAGTLAIGYKVEQDIAADISLAFSGVDENSRASIRLVVMGGNGALRIPVQFGYDGNSNEVSLERTVSLKAGDTIYIIVNRENVDGVQTNGMGELSIALEPAGAVADFGGDFSLENQDGAWSYGKAEYVWGASEDFTFVEASDKNSGGDGWMAGGVEIKKDFISFGEMAAIGYTVENAVTLRATVTVCGSTADTRADLRVGIKGADGTTKGNPSFLENPNGNILYVTVDITLEAGETVYFLFSNGVSTNPDAIPNGNLYIALTEVQA